MTTEHGEAQRRFTDRNRTLVEAIHDVLAGGADLAQLAEEVTRLYDQFDGDCTRNGHED